MKKLIPLLIIIFFVQFAYCQQEVKDDFDKAVKHLKSQNYKKAIDIFSDILLKTEDKQIKKFCYIYRAFSYNGLRDYKNAITDLNQAIEIDPDDLATYADRAKARAYNNDIEGSKEDFLYILTIDSTGKQAKGSFFYLGSIAFHEGKFEESVRWYDKLIALEPDDSEAYFNRGAAKGMMMDISGSIKDYDKAIEFNQKYAEAYANRGFAKINLLTSNGIIQPSKDQTSDACADLKKAKELGDKTVDDMMFIYCGK